MTIAGTGKSPSALVAGLVGEGRVTLAGASIPRLDPGALGRVMEKVEAPDAPIDECDAFLASYEHCLASLGPADVARARVAQTRASFVATRDKAARAALRQKCISNLAQLKTTCR